MFLMRYSNGAFSHKDIMDLTFSQFFLYLDQLMYWIKNESKDGREQNQRDEKLEEMRIIGKEGYADIKAKAEAYKKAN